VGSAASTNVPAGAKVNDARGKTVNPGRGDARASFLSGRE
jgi:hypothetical protein